MSPCTNGAVRTRAHGGGIRWIPAVVCACLALPGTTWGQSANDGFDPNADSDVWALAVQPDGKILVAGHFTLLDGQPRNHIARLQPDGSLDPSFDPNANRFVGSLAMQPDGKILIGGLFTTLSGQPRTGFARLQPDGSLDTGFDPPTTGGAGVLAVQPDGKILVGGTFTAPDGQTRHVLARLEPDGSLDPSFDTRFDPRASRRVSALAIQPDGKILIGGTFFTRLGGPAHFYIARLAPDGSLDPSFNLHFDPDPNDSPELVTALAVQADGKVLVGGIFRTLGGQARHHIARLEPDGSLDPSFDPSANDEVWALVVQPDGKILIGGWFTALGGQPRHRIARLAPDGSVDPTFDPNADYIVHRLALQPDGKVLLGGPFGAVGGQARYHIARVYPDGSLDTSFDPGANNSVEAFAVQPDGKVVVGGDFTMLGGQPRDRLARLRPDGSLDPSFTPTANDTVTALAVQPDGKVLVGGDFTMLGGQPRDRLARLWPDGSLDPSVDVGADGAVLALAVQPHGKILVGGSFTMLGGIARHNMGRLNPDGSPDAFNPDTNGPVAAVAVQPDGAIVIAGDFTTVQGLGHTRIARLHPDGSVDQNFNPTADGPVWALVVQPDGRILTGGEFGHLNGQPRTRLGRLYPDGALDTGFAPGVTNDTVLALALHSDRRILAGGTFTILGGQTRHRTGRLHGDGTLDSSFDPDANNNVEALAVQVDGKVLVGGTFTTLGGLARDRIARLAMTEVAVQSLDFVNGATGVRWVRSGSGPELAFVTFASSTDGLAYTPLGPGTRIPGGWELSGLSFPNGPLYVRAQGVEQRGASGSVHESVRRIFRGTTATALTSSANPSVAGQPVTITATVTPNAPAFSPTGSVTFTEGPTILASAVPLDAGGQASVVTDALTLGAAHSLTGTYSGDATYLGSAGGLAQIVTPAATITTIVTHVPDPSVTGQAVAVSFSVAVVAPGAGTPSGVVTVRDGEGNSCQAPVAAGSCSLTPTSSGAKTLTATYGGDASFTGSSGMIAHTVRTALTVSIDGHADGASVAHTSPFLDLSGTAGTSARTADGPAATVTGVTWENDRGGGGPTEGVTIWRVPEIPLQPGANTITIRATDDTGNTAAASVTVTVSQLLYYLAEGATGPFFDLDLLLGNPHPVDVPVTITFLKEDGSTVLWSETLSATSQRTISVNSIPGLETAAVSTVVSSDSGFSLAVARSMFWDASAPAARADDGPVIAPGATYYGGHTAKAVDSPRTTWLFAEGSQSFFDTYLLLANANPTPATVTVTYLVEGGAPVVRTVTVGATSRLTFFAGLVTPLVGTSFGIVVDASQPIIAERAMYFSAGRFWEGGHESAGVPEASTSWFHAEGETGVFFDTYILVSNSNGVPANLVVTYLLASGVALPKAYVVPANGRITINVETQDPQLAEAAVSTTVTSDVPVISERAMYWVGDFTTWYEAHNSFGVTAAGTKWGLAEGRVGTSVGYQSFILLANPTATAAQVRITYLRTNGTTVVKTYTVPPTSRFNVWVNAEVPELADEHFGALIETTGGTPIVVEQALYWNSGDQYWGGGTNATAVRLP